MVSLHSRHVMGGYCILLSTWVGLLTSVLI
ncbi:hypothetical protein [Bacillus piscicola]